MNNLPPGVAQHLDSEPSWESEEMDVKAFEEFWSPNRNPPTAFALWRIAFGRVFDRVTDEVRKRCTEALQEYESTHPNAQPLAHWLAASRVAREMVREFGGRGR